MSWSRMNWQKLFSYGEVICFVSAWLVTLLMAYTADRTPTEREQSRSFAITTDISDIQATLTR
jgi:hypothetical protein